VSGKVAAVPHDAQNVNCSDQSINLLEELYESKNFSDVNIFVRNKLGGREFQAHKAILSTRSKVFSAMFKHPTKEKLSNRVVIEDMEPDVFHEILRFIYTGRIPSAMMEKMAVGLLAAADKYLLDQLKLECQNHLVCRMSPYNCLEILFISDQHHPAYHLKQEAIKFFRRFSAVVKATDEWKTAKRDHSNHPIWFEILFAD
jgi:speckle-type POZ protein